MVLLAAPVTRVTTEPSPVTRDVLTSLQNYLDRLQDDIGKTLEKVSSREKYINNQLEHLILEYRSAHAKLSEVTAHGTNRTSLRTQSGAHKM